MRTLAKNQKIDNIFAHTMIFTMTNTITVLLLIILAVMVYRAMGAHQFSASTIYESINEVDRGDQYYANVAVAQRAITLFHDLALPSVLDSRSIDRSQILDIRYMRPRVTDITAAEHAAIVKMYKLNRDHGIRATATLLTSLLVAGEQKI